MSTSLELVGFEAGDFTGMASNGGCTISTLSSRPGSGSYGLHLQPNNQDSYGVVVGSNAFTGPRLAFGVYLQFYIRFNSRPTANNAMFCGTSSADTVVVMNKDGSCSLTKAGVGGPVGLGTPPLNLWLRCILCTWCPADRPSPAPTDNFLLTTFQWMYRGPAGDLQALGTASLSGFCLNAHNFLQAVLGGQTGSGSPTSWDVDIDDVIYMAAPSIADMNTIEKWLVHDNNGLPVPGLFTLGGLDYLPSLFYHDHIQPLLITSEAPGHSWIPANNAGTISALPSATVRTPLESSQGVGQAALYFKQLVPVTAEAWLYEDFTNGSVTTTITVPPTVEGWQMKGNATAVPSGSHQLILESLTPAPPLSVLTSTTNRGDETSPRTPARFLYGHLGSQVQAFPAYFRVGNNRVPSLMPVSTFNNFQMEMINETGDLVKLTNLYIEYLTGGGVAGVSGQPPLAFPPAEIVAPGVPPGLSNELPPPLTPGPYRVGCKDPDLTNTDSGGGSGCKDPDLTGADGS